MIWIIQPSFSVRRIKEVIVKKYLVVFLSLAMFLVTCLKNEIVVFADNAPTISVISNDCFPGDTINIDVNISDNPGIMYLEISPMFASELGDPAINNGNIFSEFTNAKQLIWTADKDVNANGKLLSVTFSVPDTIVPGNYSVSFVFRSAYDYDENTIDFLVKSGTIRVKKSGFDNVGDINGDGEVDSLDATSALKYDAGIIELNEKQLKAGDVNGDNEVDSLDATMILKFDAGIIDTFQ